MNQKTRFLMLGVITFALIQIASADIIQDLTVDITCYPCSSNFMVPDQVPHRSPAIGFANLVSPWSFSYQTALPTSWNEWTGSYYDMQFGEGGTFTMMGPHGLTFIGTVESGNATHWRMGLQEIRLNFSGVWSDGANAVGSIFQQYNVGWTWNPHGGPPLPVGEWVELDTHPTSPPLNEVPEPRSVVLLGSAALGAWRYFARYSR